jgi:hypothetical protein
MWTDTDRHSFSYVNMFLTLQIHSAFQFFIHHSTTHFTNLRVLCLITLPRNRTCPCCLVCQYILCLLPHCLHVGTVPKRMVCFSVLGLLMVPMFQVCPYSLICQCVSSLLTELILQDNPRSLLERPET